MARRRLSKRKAQKAHARRKIAERFGVVLTEPARVDLIRQIQKGEAKFVEKKTNRVTIWEMEIAGKKAHVVYDKMRKEIVSAWEAP